MNDYDFQKLSEGSVSFTHLTGRLQKLAESFADIMVDTAKVYITVDGSEVTSERLLNSFSNEEIVNGLDGLQAELKSVPSVIDWNGEVALSLGQGDFHADMVWGPSEINGIIRRVEQSVEQEVRDGALDALDFDDAVKNTFALTMDNLVGMVENGEIKEFESKIDELVDDIGLKLTDEAENGADEEARKAADYLLKESRYSIDGFFKGLTDRELDRTETEGYYWGLYEDKHQDLVTAFADEFGNHGLYAYFDLDEFSDSELGRYYRGEANRILNKAYETFKEVIKERIADYIEDNFR